MGMSAVRSPFSSINTIQKEVAERAFLHRRLAALAYKAESDAMTDDEIKTLWARFKPAQYPK